MRSKRLVKTFDPYFRLEPRSLSARTWRSHGRFLISGAWGLRRRKEKRGVGSDAMAMMAGRRSTLTPQREMVH